MKKNKVKKNIATGIFFSCHNVEDYPYEITVTRIRRKKEVRRTYKVNRRHDVIDMISKMMSNSRKYHVMMELSIYPTIWLSMR